jgi:hypothetical protein
MCMHGGTAEVNFICRVSNGPQVGSTYINRSQVVNSETTGITITCPEYTVQKPSQRPRCDLQKRQIPPNEARLETYLLVLFEKVAGDLFIHDMSMSIYGG